MAAREAEAGDGFLTFEECGVTLRVPALGKRSLKTIDLFRAGDSYGATRDLLGEEQWTRLVDAGATEEDLNELAAKIRGAWGN